MLQQQGSGIRKILKAGSRKCPVTDDRVCCENIAAAMFVTVKEMRAGPS